MYKCDGNIATAEIIKNRSLNVIILGTRVIKQTGNK